VEGVSALGLCSPNRVELRGERVNIGSEGARANYYSTTSGIVRTTQLAFDPVHLESKMAPALRNDVVEMLNVTGRQVRAGA
jgi:hypothetical protein